MASQNVPKPSPVFGFQDRLGKSTSRFLGGLTFESQSPAGIAYQERLADSSRAFRAGQAVRSWTGDTFGSKGIESLRSGTASVRRGVLHHANKINAYLQQTERGYKQGFKTVGGLVSRAPLKQLAGAYGMNFLMMTGMEVAFFGKPFSLGTLAESAHHNIPLTLSFELAGHGAKGMLRGMGWHVGGSMMGLGPWGSLGLQLAGSVYLPGLGSGLALAGAGYYAGKGAYALGKQIYRMGKGSHKTQFESGDLSFATSEAATMRQRSLGAIQKSHLNMRQLLGNEASFLMGR